MICRKCKEYIPSDSKFCSHCGARQSVRSLTPILFSLPFILCIVGILFGIWQWTRADEAAEQIQELTEQLEEKQEQIDVLTSQKNDLLKENSDLKSNGKELIAESSSGNVQLYKIEP